MQQSVNSKAIKKYGWDGFTHEIIRTGLTKEDACIAERKLIKKYKSRDPRYGYNISCGGEAGSKGRKQSEEERFRRRIASLTAWSDPELREAQSIRLKGLKRSDEVKARMKEAAKKKAPPTEEQKLKISATLREYFSNPENRKKQSESHAKYSVRCVDTGHIYASSHEAARDTGVYQGNIYACCLKKRKKAGGFRWEFFDEDTEPVAS